MKIYYSDGQEILGLLSAIFRTDLIPIPLSLEAVIHGQGPLDVGQVLILNDGVEMSIIKSQVHKTNVIRDGQVSQATHIIAIPKDLQTLIKPTKKAVNLTNTSFGEIYQALGAKGRFGSDIRLSEFVCLNGQIPTERIALALQKEAAVICYAKQQCNAIRIAELLKNTAHNYHREQVQWLNIQSSPTSYLSVDDNGTDIQGLIKQGTNHDYAPRTDDRQLRNMARILVARGIITSVIDDRLNAGQILDIDGKKYVVLTNAVRVDTGIMGGNMVTASKAWISEFIQ